LVVAKELCSQYSPVVQSPVGSAFALLPRKRVDKIKTPKKYLTCLINATLFRSIHHRQTKLSLP